jgi:hypothetical protein
MKGPNPQAQGTAEGESMGALVKSRASPVTGASRALDDPLPVVRAAVRDLLTACPAYAELDPAKRRELAGAMVRVCYAAASLIREEVEGGGEVPVSPAQPPRLARAQAAPDPGATARQVAGTTRAILNAVSFPSFVTDLINGVFKAMIDSTQTQMQSYVELLNGVAASTEGFADSQMGLGRARAWLVDHYPDSFEFETSVDDEDMASMSPEERAEVEQERSEIKLRARPGGKAPSEQALRADLGLAANESVPAASNPEGLVPLVRQRLAKMRQEMLATLVQMGMQRIVVESGRITASMRFHIDTRDALARDEGSRFGTEHEIAAKGSFGYGPWGVSAAARSNISYVSTQKTQSTQEMNTELDLNSSVEINFKSDYVPLDRLAAPGQRESIRSNSRNPDAEASAADATREKRTTAARDAEAKRRDSLDKELQPSSRAPLEAETPPAPYSTEPKAGGVTGGDSKAGGGGAVKGGEGAAKGGEGAAKGGGGAKKAAAEGVKK